MTVGVERESDAGVAEPFTDFVWPLFKFAKPDDSRGVPKIMKANALHLC